MTRKWNLIIDVAGCENCNNCTLAAKDEHVGNDFPGYSAPHAAQGSGVIRIRRAVRGRDAMVDVAYLPTMCNHCDEAPCVAAGKGAVVKRDDGIVLFDPEKCRGQRHLVDACPYGAVVWNDELQLPQTWIFDAHLLDTGWAAPRCVTVCPTGAIQAVKISDQEMALRARRDGLAVLHPERGTRPRVHYRNLHRFDSCFIGGSVLAHIAGRVECVAGAEVRLAHGGTGIASVHSDVFGDFRFDGLAPGSGLYELRVSHPVLGGAERHVELGADSVVLGGIPLAADSVRSFDRTASAAS